MLGGRFVVSVRFLGSKLSLVVPFALSATLKLTYSHFGAFCQGMLGLSLFAT